MNVTGNRGDCRILREEGRVQRISAEQKRYEQVHTCEKITENNNTNVNIQTDNLLEKILHAENKCSLFFSLELPSFFRTLLVNVS